MNGRFDWLSSVNINSCGVHTVGPLEIANELSFIEGKCMGIVTITTEVDIMFYEKQSRNVI